MKKHKINLRILWRYASVVFTTILISAVMYLCLLSICAADQETQILRVADKMDFSNIVYYSSYQNWIMSDIEKQEEYDRILAADGVMRAQKIETIQVSDVESGTPINLVFYDCDALESVRYELVQGEYPDPNSCNCILLSESYMQRFVVGELIDVYYYSPDYVISNDTLPPVITLRVSGFMAEQPIYAPGIGGDGIGLNDLIRDNYPMGVIYNLVDNDGRDLDRVFSGFEIVNPQEGVSTSDLKTHLQNVVCTPAFVLSGQDIIHNYLAENAGELRIVAGLILAAAAMAISLIFSRMIMLESIYEREMAIMYICGSTWGKAVWSLYAPFILELLLGISLGTFLYVFSIGLESFSPIIVRFKVSYLLEAGGILLLLMIASAIPIFGETVRKSPLEIFRKD